jgi:hypothetical protein
LADLVLQQLATSLRENRRENATQQPLLTETQQFGNAHAVKERAEKNHQVILRGYGRYWRLFGLPFIPFIEAY